MDERYQKVRKVGEGTYAVVYEGIDTQTNRPVAIKRIKVNASGLGLDISAIRELIHLRHLQHPNLVDLLDVYVPAVGRKPPPQQLHLVLGFYPHDLEGLLRDRTVVIHPADVKAWMLMLLRGVAYCHQRGILHRDLKPNNLLLDSTDDTSVLKIADFGLARGLGLAPVDPAMTPGVVTRWYRAPELLFGARAYSGAVDVWAVGCIFAEMFLRTPLFPGESDLSQLRTISQLLGPPSEAIWPGVSSLPDYLGTDRSAADLPSSSWSAVGAAFAGLFPAVSADARDLMQRMLTYDPLKRITAMEALAHPYFTSLPRPTPSAQLPRPVKRLES